ncbi:glycosyltransferase family 4 protein [Porticoccus sp. GXU_MW_L64]
MNILILSFYFRPDLCAGSFRCSSLVDQLVNVKHDYVHLDVLTTLPNRYTTFSSEAEAHEIDDRINIHRVKLPSHSSGMLDQAKAFLAYYREVKKLTHSGKYDVVYATSSRLMTAFLGARISRSFDVPLYLDIRDIFVDTIKDVLPKPLAVLIKPVFGMIERYSFGSAKRINLVSKGFRPYFLSRYPKVDYRWFTNGIDSEFIGTCQDRSIELQERCDRDVIRVVYAGNIGEGQGLHTIIPLLAKAVEGKVRFKIIGDGGRRSALEEALRAEGVNNVEVVGPVNREDLIVEYQSSDVLFLHLNDYPAFKKVLPSKIFEYAAMGKPILAGVSGFAAQFIEEEVNNSVVFSPGDWEEGTRALDSMQMGEGDRSSFIEKYLRENIMREMAADIISFGGNGEVAL